MLKNLMRKPRKQIQIVRLFRDRERGFIDEERLELALARLGEENERQRALVQLQDRRIRTD